MDRPTIHTPQDLRNYPNFVGSIDPKIQPLSHIITGYYLNEEYPCGLKGCHQPHKEGYLVALEDGNVSNVGWKCGEAFGEKFAIEKTRYTDLILRPKAIQTIQEAIVKIHGLRQDLDNLATEADRLSQCKLGMRNYFPKLYKELDRRAHSGTDRVVEQIERTSKEIEDLQALSPGASRESFRYRDEPRGVLQGIRVLAGNFRDDVIIRLTGRATELQHINVTSLPTDKLLDWERWAQNFDDTVTQARATISAGNALFSLESFRLMTYIATVDTERAKLKTLTVATLLRSGSGDAQVVSVHPAKQSKRDRDSQKRLEATLQKARNKGR
ncbi:MAG: hypothetical protein NT159_24645 [Proteobacteria bacterium]|nr:hypothetical protein [Pseudomonadota bacterium]